MTTGLQVLCNCGNLVGLIGSQNAQLLTVQKTKWIFMVLAMQQCFQVCVISYTWLATELVLLTIYSI